MCAIPQKRDLSLFFFFFSIPRTLDEEREREPPHFANKAFPDLRAL